MPFSPLENWHWKRGNWKLEREELGQCKENLRQLIPAPQRQAGPGGGLKFKATLGDSSESIHSSDETEHPEALSVGWSWERWKCGEVYIEVDFEAVTCLLRG